MKSMKVIKNVPTRIPLISGLVMQLALEHYNAPEWLYAVWYTIYIPMFIACIVIVWRQEHVDIFEEFNKLLNEKL